MRREKTAAGCGTFGYYMKNILKFLLSHIGLVSLVVGYTLIGAVSFQALEAEQEIMVKRNVTATRQKVRGIPLFEREGREVAWKMLLAKFIAVKVFCSSVF